MMPTYDGLDKNDKFPDLSLVSEENYLKIKEQVYKMFSNFYLKNPYEQQEILDNYRKHLSDSDWVIFYNTLKMPNDLKCMELIKNANCAELKREYNVTDIEIALKREEYKIFPLSLYIEEGKIDPSHVSYDFPILKAQQDFEKILETINAWNLQEPQNQATPRKK